MRRTTHEQVSLELHVVLLPVVAVAATVVDLAGIWFAVVVMRLDDYRAST